MSRTNRLFRFTYVGTFIVLLALSYWTEKDFRLEAGMFIACLITDMFWRVEPLDY